MRLVEAAELKASWARARWVLLVLGCVLAFNLLFTPGFFKIQMRDGHAFGSLVDIVDRAAPVMLLALGMTLVIATGGVDLSVGAVMAIIGTLGAKLVAQGQHAFPPVVGFCLAAGCALGVWNGALVGFARIQPIVATLILMVAGRGIAQLLSGGQIITFEHPAFVFLGNGFVGGLPVSYAIVLVAFLATAVLVRKTALGLFFECVGENEAASRYAGIQTRLVKCLAYGASGFFAAIAGLIVAADIQAADANNAGLYLELDAILAVVLGGTALAGGRFYLFNSLLGAVLMQTLTTTILTRGVPVELTLVVKALIILLVCLVQSEQFRAACTRVMTRKREIPAQ